MTYQSLCLPKVGIHWLLDTPPTSEWAAAGDLAPLVALSVPTDIPATGEYVRRLDDAHSAVKSIAAERGDSAEVLTICFNAIEALQVTYARVTAPGARVDSIWYWPLLLPETFMMLISEAHPSALVALAYFAALMRCFEVYWWAKGWSESVVKMIVERLGVEMFDRVQWPVRCVREGIDVRTKA